MPIDENGNYERWQGPERCQNDRDQSINILASRMDDDLNDIADAIGQMVNAKGTKPMAGNLNMGGNSIKNAGPAVEASDAPTAEQVQGGVFNWAVDTSSTPNKVQVFLNPARTTQPNSLLLTVQVKNTNTEASTLQVNALEEKPILYGTAPIPANTLMGGQVYMLAYNKTLDAYQLMLSGSATVPGSMPLLATIEVDGLLTGDAKNGWELQGTKCYRSKYEALYDQLEEEYNDATTAVETIVVSKDESKQFTYKVNPDTKRRFYTVTDYNARFDFCGDTGGYIVDTDGKYFILRKRINYARPTDDTTRLGEYERDQVDEKMVGEFNAGAGSGSVVVATGVFKKSGKSQYQGMFYHNGSQDTVAFAPEEVVNTGNQVQPRGTLMALYYRCAAPATNGVQVGVDDELLARIEALEAELAALKAGTKLVAGDNVVIEEISPE